MSALLWIGAALAANPALEGAMEAELARSTQQLRLEGEAAPWWIGYDVVDGDYCTYYAEFGALIQDEVLPHRVMRVEVRTGDAAFDSANFDALGEPDGVVMGGLPLEDDPVAIQRQLWQATDIAYKQAIEQLSRKHAELVDPPEGPAMAPITPVVDLDAEALPLEPERIKESVQHLSRILAEYPELEAGQAAGRDWQGVRYVFTSEGTRLAQASGLAVIRVEATTKAEDGSKLRNARWWVADRAADLPPLEEMEREVREMAEWLVALRTAPVIQDYLGPVLFEGPAAVELFLQLAANELVGTPPPSQGRIFGEPLEARPPGRVGRRLLPEGWTMVDDPTQEEAVGDYAYDHEGVPAERVLLVEDGVVHSLLLSRIPVGPDSRSNGHGRALGTDRRSAVPAVVKVEPKRSRSERALKRRALRLARQTHQDAVLVVRRIEPAPMSEGFDIYFSGEGPAPGLTNPYEAYLLHADGSIEPVRGMQFVGVDRRVLRDIDMAGAPGPYVGVLDATPGPGRYHIGAVGGMPASWSVPPVLITEMELIGNEGGDVRRIPPPEVK